MKAIMYHYVRYPDPRLPHFPFLSFDDFRKQLDWFERTGRLILKEEFEKSFEDGNPVPDVYIPTFDDGFVEHVELVLPELVSRGSVGIFFIPTGPLINDNILDVHKIHYLLGYHGGTLMLDRTLRVLVDFGVVLENAAERAMSTYFLQPQSAATEFKRILNYICNRVQRKRILDYLCKHFLPSTEFRDRLYVTEEQIRLLKSSGMIIGSHSHTHELLKRLPKKKQKEEINKSLDYLSTVINQKIHWFCYPYGGPQSYDETTQEFLGEANCRYAFDVNPRDITAEDLKNNPWQLPRYDCNLFPHGKATIISS